MKTLRMVSALILVGVTLLVTAPNRTADAQGQTIKIGVLFDHTGPSALGESRRRRRHYGFRSRRPLESPRLSAP